MTRSISLCIAAMFLFTACASVRESMGLGKNSSEPPAELSSLETPGAKVAPPTTGPGLQLSPEQRFKEVPMPVGLKEDSARTFVYESTGLQIGRLVYTSKASVGELAQFYLQECRTASWELVNVVQADGADILFKKAGKRLSIKITDRGLTGGRVRELVILMSPEGNP